MLVSLALMAVRLSQADTINVFAAASLRSSLTTIVKQYEGTHARVKINLTFAGSQLLAAQINGGAKADVFASADQTNLAKVSYDKASRRVFARNTLAVVFTPDQHLQNVNDLMNVSRIVVAHEAVPVGTYTAQFLGKASRVYGLAWLQTVRKHIVSKEQDVKSVLTKVLLGEADAGIVYITDAKTAPALGTIVIPRTLNVIAEYPIAVISDSPNPKTAKGFIDFVLSSDGQQCLTNEGFLSAMAHVRNPNQIKVRRKP